MPWDEYPIDRDGRPHRVVWRIEAYGRAPDRTRPLRLDVSVPLAKPGPDGLPSAEEAETLVALRDALEADVCEATEAKYVLRVAGDGKVVHSFYAPPSRGFFRRRHADREVERVLRELAGEFPGYAMTVSAEQDEEWEAFFAAFPSSDGVQWFADARQVQALHAAGVPIAEARQVVHWLYFPSEAARQTFTEGAEAAGFEVVEVFASAEDSDQPHALRVRREEPSLGVHDVHRASSLLTELSRAVEGDYARWSPEGIALIEEGDEEGEDEEGDEGAAPDPDGAVDPEDDPDSAGEAAERGAAS